MQFHRPSADARRDAFDGLFGILKACVGSAGPLDGLATRLLDRTREDGHIFVAHLAVQKRLFSYPTEKFLDACATVLTWDFDPDEVEVRHDHGWPILSLRLRTATIAGEGDGASLALPGDASTAEAA